MPSNFRKHLTAAAGRPVVYVSKAASTGGNGSTADLAYVSPVAASVNNSSGPTANSEFTARGEGSVYTDGANTIIVGAGHYQGACTQGMPHRLIADGKVVWYVNGNLLLGTKIDSLNASNHLVDGFIFRFVQKWRCGVSGGGFISIGVSNYSNCSFDFVSNADVNCAYWGTGGNYLVYNTNTNCIFRRLHSNGRHAFDRCLLFSSITKDTWRFKGCYADVNSQVELRSTAMFTNGEFQNNNIQGQIRVVGDTYGYTDLATFKANYGLTGRLDLVSSDPKFNKASAEDYTLKIDSPHLDLQIGPSALRYALMYYVDSSVSPGDACTVANTKLKSTADNSLISFLDIGGFTTNAAGGLVIQTNSQGNYEGYYTTKRIPVAATTQRIVRLPVISGLNFDTDYPAAASGFSSVLPEVFNNNVPDYSNATSGSAGRNPNRLTVQARFSTLASPDELVNEHWLPSNGTYFDFEIDEQPQYDSVSGYGSGHPLFDPASANVRPVLARFLQIRYKARNDYFSK
jgi:hypothetical protein